MSVEQTDVIDIVSVDKQTGDVILTISDHLPWGDTVEHQKILQEKLNKYLASVESGEIVERYPDAKGRKTVFKIVFKFSPDVEGTNYLERTRQVIRSAGFDLLYELFAR
jgi:uncharacterized protein DUF6572